MARAVIGALRVVLGLDSAEFTKGINSASRSTKQFAAASKAMEGAANTLQNSLRGLGSAIGVVSVGAAAKGFLDLAAKSAQMTAQMKLATAEFGNFAQAQQDARRIAAETRSGISETAKLYGNFIRAVKDLGGTQGDAAIATETFSKALKIGGASSEEAASATLQFGQALASGVLRGDEFNSIMEASPRIARLLADSLGVPIGQLRALAEQGDLTSDKLLKALIQASRGIDTEFQQLPVAFSDAMSQVYNAGVVTFGAFDSGGQFSKAIAGFVMGGANGFGELEDGARRLGIEVRATIEGLAAVWNPFLEGGLSVLEELGVKSSNLFKPLRDQVAEVLGIFDDIANIIPDIAGEGSPLKGLWNVDSRGTFLRRSAQSQARLTSESLPNGSIIGSAMEMVQRAVGNIPSRGIIRAPAARSAGKAAKVATTKASKSTPDYGADSYYDWLGELRESVATPFDFGRLDQSVDQGLDYIVKKFEDASKSGSEAMVNLVNNSLNALNNFASAIKNGGFLDILSSAFNAFGALSKQGLFGSGLASTFKDFAGISGFRAFGGPVTAGRSYIVGERGPELFTASRSGYIHPNGSNGSRGITVNVNAKDAVLTHTVAQWVRQGVEEAAMRGTVGGAAGATQHQLKRERRRLV